MSDSTDLNRAKLLALSLEMHLQELERHARLTSDPVAILQMRLTVSDLLASAQRIAASLDNPPPPALEHVVEFSDYARITHHQSPSSWGGPEGCDSGFDYARMA